MKLTLGLLILTIAGGAHAQAWKTLPKGVRILGYRNVTTSTIRSNFNKQGAESSMSPEFKVDSAVINSITGNAIVRGTDLSAEAYDKLTVGEYKVNASANAKVHGLGFGYGISDKVMYYVEMAFYNTVVNANIQRTKGNNFQDVANGLRASGRYQDQPTAQLVEGLVDINTNNVQSVVTNYFGYKPVGTWYGSGYGDMETGIMYKAIDKGVWGLQLYPGLILPTGRQDDPDMLQDLAYGDGQLDVFGEMATGYVFNDRFSIGSTLRYTYQSPTTKELRVPTERDFPLSQEKDVFNVKYGDKFSFMINAPYSFNDWVSIIPFYRFMYQLPTEYDSKNTEANGYLGYNSDKMEHQVQLTASLSSVQPFLKKKFLLPAQINMNLVQVVGGKNVAKAGRFELELRMIF